MESRELTEMLTGKIKEVQAAGQASDIDMALGCLRCGIVLYMKSETEHGRRPSIGDFRAFAASAYGLMEDVVKARQ